MEPARLFQPLNEIPKWRILYNVVKDCPIGTFLNYSQLDVMTGLEIRGTDRMTVYAANRKLLKDDRKCLLNTFREGYRIATPEEQMGQAAFRRVRAARQIRKGTAEINGLNQAIMTDDQKLRAVHLANHLQSSLGVLRKHSEKALSETRMAVKSQEIGIDKIDEMMKQLMKLKEELKK